MLNLSLSFSACKKFYAEIFDTIAVVGAVSTPPSFISIKINCHFEFDDDSDGSGGNGSVVWRAKVNFSTV